MLTTASRIITMELFGVGIGEVLLILILALILLGPQGMVKTAHKIGVGIRSLLRSPVWAMMLDTTRELRDMPTRLVREAGFMDDVQKFNEEAAKSRNFILDDLDLDQPVEETAGPPESVPARRTILPPRPAYPQVYPDQDSPAPAEPNPEP